MRKQLLLRMAPGKDTLMHANRRLAGKTLLLVLLMAISLPCLAQASHRREAMPPPRIPDALGVNIHFTDPRPGEIRRIADAGFRWIRMDLTWDQIERERGQYNWSAYDRLLDALKPFGISAVLILDYGNSLYGSGWPKTPEARAAFARFAAAAAVHFRHRSILWEMWNEPNSSFWKPQEYIALATEVGQAVHRTTPEAHIIGPGICGIDLPFFEACCRSGLLKYWDAVSFHPYRGAPPETAADDFLAVRRLISRYAPRGRNIPIVSSEWGYSTLDDASQSRLIARLMLSNLASGLIVSIWYDWRDDGTNPKELEHHFGVLHNDYSAKSTCRSIQALAHSLDGFRFNKRLALSSPDDYCLLFTRGRVARLAVWSISSRSHNVLLPVSPGTFQIVSSTGASMAVSAGAHGMQIQLTDTPQYLIPTGENSTLALAAGWNTAPREIQADTVPQAQQALRAIASGHWQQEAVPRNMRLEVCALSASGQVSKRIVARFPAAGIPPLPCRIDRTGPPARIQFRLHTRSGYLTQQVNLVARRPLDLTITPPLGATVPVRIVNASDQRFDGWIALRSVGSTACSRVAMEPLHLMIGERERWMYLSLPANAFGKGVGHSLTLACEVIEAAPGSKQRRVTGVTAPMTFVPWARFDGYTAGSPLPADDFAAVPDGAPEVAATVSAVAATPPPGLSGGLDRVARIDYRFATGWKFLRLEARGAKGCAVSGKPRAVGMWVWNNNPDATLHARFTDTTGQTFQLNGSSIGLNGWYYEEFSLTGKTGGYWDGADDGIIHYPIRISSPLLVDLPACNGGHGTVYCTSPTLIYGTP